MKIQKYKAKIIDSQKEVVGYITEIKEYLSSGTYGSGTDYMISVTEKSMIKSDYGNFKVAKESIEEFNECPECEINEQNKDFGYFACSQKCYDKL
tara:strand:+ start:179 stop:463 length:285 start_codon:yes stop_codon:yes gene_type:complete